MNDSNFRNYFEASPIPFLILEINTEGKNSSPEYLIADVNPAFEKMTGLITTKITGKTVRHQFLDTECTASGFRDIFERVIEENGTTEFHHFIEESGRWFLVHAWRTDGKHVAVTFSDITASMQTQEFGCLKAIQHHAFWDNNLFGVIVADKNANYVDANQEACRMTGYSCEELKTMNIFSLIEPERIDDARTHFEQIARTGKAYGEVAYYTKSGEKRWWNVVAIKFSDDFFLGLHEDITSRKRAEQQLFEEREHHANVISNISDVLWEYEVDATGNFVRSYISPVVNRLLGLPDGTIENDFESFFSYIHPDDLQLVKTRISDSFFSVEQVIHQVEYRVITSSGNNKYLRSSGIVHAKPDGHRLSYGVTSDITELKNKEEELYKIKANVTAIVENTLDNVWAIDKNYEIIYLNENFRKAYQATFNIMLQPGSNKLQSLPESMVPVWKERYDKVLSGERIEFIDKIDLAETTIYIEVAGNPIVQDGTVIGASFFGKDITKRKMMEQELSHNVELNKKLLASIPDVVIRTNLEGVITFVNEPVLVNYPFISPAHLLGKNILSFVIPQDLKRIEENFRLMFEKPLGIKEYALSFGQDIEIQCEVNGDVIRGEDGNPTGLVFVIRDITERKKAEKLLIESEERFRLMIKNISSILVKIDKDGIQKFVSPAAERITGYTQEELMGRAMSEVIHPDDMPRVMKIWEEGISQPNNELTVQYRHIHKTKGWVHVEAIGQSFLHEPAVNAVIAIVQDITERIQSENRIEREKVHFQHLFEHSPVATWLEDYSELIQWFLELRAQGVDDLKQYLLQNRAQIRKGLSLIRVIDINHSGLVQNAATSREQLTGNLLRLFCDETFTQFLNELEAIWQGYEQYEYESHSKKLNGEPLNVIVRLSIPKIDGILDYSRVVVTGTDITERKRVEQSLRENELKFRTLFENSGDAIFLMKGETFIDCNVRTLEIYGCQAPEQILGHTPFEFSPTHQPNGRESLEYALEIIRAASTGQPQYFEWLHTKRDGTLFLAEVKLNKLELNEQLYLQAIVRDITERKRAEKELKANEERLSLLIELAPDAFLRGADNGSIIGVNTRAIEMFGYEKDEFLTMKFEELFPPEVLEANPLRYDLVNSGMIVQMERQMRKKNGDTIFIDMSSRAMPDATYQSFIRDISERKHTEAELIKAKEQAEESERKYRNLFDTMPSGYYRSTPEGYFIDANPAFLQMLGYDSLEEIKKIYIPTALYVETAERDEVIKINPEFVDQVENYRLKTKNGDIIWIEDNARYIRNEHNEILFHEGICKDITGRKLAEQSLHKSEIRNRSLLEAIPDMIFVFDRQGHLIDFNASNPEGLLMVPEHFIGKHHTETLPPDIASKTDEVLRKVFSTKQIQEFGYQLELHGQTHYFEARVVYSNEE